MTTYTFNGIKFQLPSEDSMNRFQRELELTNQSITMDDISDEVPECFIDMFPTEQPDRILVAWRKFSTNIQKN